MPKKTYLAKHAMTLLDGRSAALYEYPEGRVRLRLDGKRYDLDLTSSAAGDAGTNAMLKPRGA